jgi:iron complex outermembrane receptor protein
LTWSKPRARKTGIEIFAGAENITNEKYSLGNDINAFGGRYYNPAAPVSCYVGLALIFSSNRDEF